MFLVRFFREVEQEEKQHILCPFPACTLFQPAKTSTPRGLSITVLLALRAILSLSPQTLSHFWYHATSETNHLGITGPSEG